MLEQGFLYLVAVRTRSVLVVSLSEPPQIPALELEGRSRLSLPAVMMSLVLPWDLWLRFQDESYCYPQTLHDLSSNSNFL